MSETGHSIAQKTQDKFEFYIISLVFTLLALSIQTAKFGSSITADILELSGWFALLVSGMAGLWRMEFVPVQLEKLALRDDLEKEVRELREWQLKGQKEVFILHTNSSISVEQRLKNRHDNIELLALLISKLDRRNMIKYYVSSILICCWFVLACGCTCLYSC